jgi:hypothetical protein
LKSALKFQINCLPMALDSSIRSMSAPAPQPRHIYGTLKGDRRFFSVEDDQTLRQLKTINPDMTWMQLADQMPGFSPRQLRERWCNYLSPGLKTGSWTPDEDRELIRLQDELGPRWRVIGTYLGNRSAPDIKNRFHCIHQRTKQSEDDGKMASSDDGNVHPIQKQMAPPPLSDRSGLPRAPPPARTRTMTGANSNKKNETPNSKASEFSIKNILAQ